MNRTAHAQSKRSHAGNAAEAMLEQQHAALAALGLAVLYRIPTPVALVRKGATLVATHKARAATDYVGHDARGRAILIEAKHVQSRTLASGAFAPTSFSLSRVEPHQALALSRAHDAGATAVLVIVVDQGRLLFAVPWHACLDASPTLRGPALERHRVKAGALYLPLPSV